MRIAQLVSATRPDQLVEPDNPKQGDCFSSADIARMEREIDSLSRDFTQIEDEYGKNVLSLVIVVAHLKTLIDNARVVRYLAANYPEILTEFQKTAEARSLTDYPVQP